MRIKRYDSDERTSIKRAVILLGICFIFIIVCTSDAKSQAIRIVAGTGNQTLSITTGVAGLGGQPLPVVNTTTRLRYRRQNTWNLTKITVRTVCAGQRYNLSVVATGVTYGVAQPAVDLVNGMAAVDLITDIPNRTVPVWTSTVTLQYAASEVYAQGNSAEMGNDVHTVTYTLLVQ